MPEATDVKITWNIGVWETLTVSYTYSWTNPEWATEFQRYRNGEAISGETTNSYIIKITDQSCDLICAVAPVDDQNNVGEIAYSEPLTVELYSLEIKPIEKQYIVKLYDQDMTFLKIVPAWIITKDIRIQETIDAGQWELTLDVNLPIDTDFFENAMFVKIYVNNSQWMQDLLIYTWQITQVQRQFSNDAENIRIVCLSLRALMSNVILRNSSQDPTFSKTWDPADIMKFIVDYFSSIYPWLVSYTWTSIENYGSSITIQFDKISCQKAMTNLVRGLNYHLFIWADGVVNYKAKPQTATHLLTYWKDIIQLTIPEDTENIENVVQVAYTINNVEYFTGIAKDQSSVDKYMHKETIIERMDLPDQSSAELYRDEYLGKNKDAKKNITLVVNSLYNIEYLHPWDTVKIRNLWLNIDNAQIQNVRYQYEQATLTLEYYTSIWQQIFNS